MTDTKKTKRASLSISKEAKGMLGSIKHTGQSYDSLIRELVIFREIVMLWKKRHGVKESGLRG